MKYIKNTINHSGKVARLIIPALLFILQLSGTEAYTQGFKDSPYNKRILSINSGLVFSGDGDCWGFGSSISHLKTFGKRFYTRQNITSWIVNGESWIDGAFENQSGIDLSAELGISPFKMGQRIFSIHGGVCGAYLVNTSPSSGGTWSSYNYITGESSYMQYYNQGFEKDLDVGITFGVDYHRQITPALYINARADFRTHYKTYTTISMITVGLGFDAQQLFKK